MQPAAAASDPEIAAGYAASMRQRRVTMEGVAAGFPRNGRRADVDETVIADALWSLASPEMFSLFTRQAARSAEEYEQWLVQTLTSLLCSSN
ncbi:MAG TPA: hypothetical protein VGD91_15315 [Trebonia sp.]